MRTIILLALVLFSITGCLTAAQKHDYVMGYSDGDYYNPYNTTTIRSNTAYGTPDYFKKGSVIVPQRDGSAIIYREYLPGTGLPDYFAPSSTITRGR